KRNRISITSYISADNFVNPRNQRIFFVIMIASGLIRIYSMRSHSTPWNRIFLALVLLLQNAHMISCIKVLSLIFIDLPDSCSDSGLYVRNFCVIATLLEYVLFWTEASILDISVPLIQFTFSTCFSRKYCLHSGFPQEISIYLPELVYRCLTIEKFTFLLVTKKNPISF